MASTRCWLPETPPFCIPFCLHDASRAFSYPVMIGLALSGLQQRRMGCMAGCMGMERKNDII